MNITMTIDDDLVKKARRIAFEKNTTFTEMVRQSLRKFVQKEYAREKKVLAKLEKIYTSSKARVGAARWEREDLYER